MLKGFGSNYEAPLEPVRMIYLHVPFCDSRCHYCSFHTYTDQHELIPSYLQALSRQIAHDLDASRVAPASVTSLFFGGGTPSVIDAPRYAPLFEKLGPYLHETCEITVEANPNSASKAWLKQMHRLGVNRVSFGIQSFRDDKLAFLARAHRAQKARDAVWDAADVGFARISLDLLCATAMDSLPLLEAEIDEALALPIEHLSLYELTIEPGTRFYRTPEASKPSAEQLRFAREKLDAAGFKQYEISNYGKPCRHNLGYWRYEPYLGLGCGAVGRIGSVRYRPRQTLKHYLDDPFFKETEHLHSRDIRLEKLFLGLRSQVGICEADLTPSEQDRAKLLATEAKLQHRGRRYYNNDYLLSDELALYIAD